MPVVTPLPSGRGVTGDEPVAEVSEPAEHRVAIRRKPVIDSDVPLILIVHLADVREKLFAVPDAVGSGYRCSSDSDTGSMRPMGIVLPGNGVRIDPTVVAGS